MIPPVVTPHTIVLLGSPNQPPVEEGVYGGTVKPGYLIEVNSSGLIVAHSVAGGVHRKWFADVDLYQGGTIADVYLSGARAFLAKVQQGNRVWAWLKAGENVVIGDDLISGGDGTLIKATGTIKQYVGKAAEALDLSGGGAVATHIRVDITD
jgi:hypothetical protein